MARLSKLLALFAFSYCLTFEHVFASPDPINPVHYLLQARGPDDPECHVEPYNAPQIMQQTFPPFDPETAYVYRYRQQQSVNLGSW